MKTFIKVNAVIAAVGLVMAVTGSILLSVKWNAYAADTVSYEESLTDSEIKNTAVLNINTGFSSLKIISGDEFKLTAENVPEAFAAHLSADDKEISLSSPEFDLVQLLKKKNLNTGSSGEYTLCIPEDYSFKNLDIDFAFGSININEINAENAEFSVAYSDTDVNIAASGSVNIDASFGDTNIDLLHSKCSLLNISSAFGNCDIKNLTLTGSADIDTSFGDTDILLSEGSYKFLKSNAFGECSISVPESEKGTPINISNAFGSVTVKQA